MVTLDKLKDSLNIYEQQLEQAKAFIYRLDGAIQATKQMIADFDKPEEVVKPEDPQ